MKKTILFLVGLSSLMFLSCAEKLLSPELKALMVKHESGDLGVDDWNRILFLQYLERADMLWVVTNYEAQKNLLSNQPMASIYYATALCSLGGRTDKIEEKLQFVRKGIGEFDRIATEFPQEIQLNLWRSITYSNFPDILGVNTQVEEDVRQVESFLNGGGMLEPAEKSLLLESYLNLAENYKNPLYLAQVERLAQELPEAGSPNLLDRLASLKTKLRK